MRVQWAVPIVFGIALMLGFTPAQSNAENSACDKILELVAAGKIPAQAAEKILEKLACDEKVVKITTIFVATGDPVPDVSCTIQTPSEGLFEEGVTDVNGELILTVPNTISEIFQTNCIRSEAPALFGTECEVALTNSFTEIEIVLFGGPTGGCF